MKILYVKASPRGEESYSIRCADAFLSRLTEKHPDAETDTLDLFTETLPEFGATASEGKYAIMYGKEGSDEAKEAWRAIEAAIDRVKQAEVYIFAIPMWNFSIPYKMKHFIDVITQPKHTFSVSENGYEGLLKNKKAFVVYARGGAYGPGSGREAYDQQQPYVNGALQFMGVTDQTELLVEPTLMDKGEVLQKFIAEAESAADRF